MIPSSYDLEVLIEFPDGHVRPLVSTTLFVDGVSEDINTAPPFEQFTWDLSEYASSGTHDLKVEALDSLGMSSASTDVPVAIMIKEQTVSSLATLSDNRTLLAGMVVVIAGAVLTLVLVLGGRLRPGMWRTARRRQRQGDTIPQPVKVKTEPSSSQTPPFDLDQPVAFPSTGGPAKHLRASRVISLSLVRKIVHYRSRSAVKELLLELIRSWLTRSSMIHPLKVYTPS